MRKREQKTRIEIESDPASEGVLAFIRTGGRRLQFVQAFRDRATAQCNFDLLASRNHLAIAWTTSGKRRAMGRYKIDPIDNALPDMVC